LAGLSACRGIPVGSVVLLEVSSTRCTT